MMWFSTINSFTLRQALSQGLSGPVFGGPVPRMDDIVDVEALPSASVEVDTPNS